MNSTKLQQALQLLKEAEDDEPTLSDLWERFTRERQLAETTWKSYRCIWGAQFERRWGHLRPNELTRDMVLKWRAERAEQPTKTRSPKTTPGCRNSEFRVLRSILSWAVEAGLIGRNPVASIEPEIGVGVRETLISPEQVAAVERHASREDWALFCLCVFGGVRKNEARTMRWEHIDLEAGTVRVLARRAKGGRKGRVTVINEVAVAALRAINTGKSGWLFPSRRHPERPIAPQTITWRWDRLRKRAGITGADGSIWLHDTRRTWGSAMVEVVPVPEVLAMAGWAGVPTFIKHYHRLSPQRIREIRNVVDGLAKRSRKPARKPSEQSQELKIYKRY